MSHLRVTILLLFLTASAALFAQAKNAAPPRSIDIERSTITVHVYRSGLFSFAGDNHEVRAPIASGTVDEGARTVEFTVDARKLKVLDPNLSADKRSQVQKKMLSPDVLDPDRYREIKFHSSSAEQKSNGEMLVHGRLTLHGQTRPVVVNVSGEQHRYRGSATLKQTDFGMKPIRVAGGTVKVKDEVKIDCDILTH